MQYNYQYEKKKKINTIRLRNKIEKNWKKIICLWFIMEKLILLLRIA